MLCFSSYRDIKKKQNIVELKKVKMVVVYILLSFCYYQQCLQLRDTYSNKRETQQRTEAQAAFVHDTW